MRELGFGRSLAPALPLALVLGLGALSCGERGSEAETGGEPGRALPRLVAEGDAHFHARRYVEAAERYREATRQFPDEAGPYFQFGHALLAAGEFRVSARALEQGLRRDPEWPRKRFLLRDFFSNPGEVDAQVEALKARVEARPKDADAWFLLGYLLHFSPERASARRVFQETLSAAPDHPGAVAFLVVEEDEGAP